MCVHKNKNKNSIINKLHSFKCLVFMLTYHLFVVEYIGYFCYMNSLWQKQFNLREHFDCYMLLCFCYFFYSLRCDLVAAWTFTTMMGIPKTSLGKQQNTEQKQRSPMSLYDRLCTIQTWRFFFFFKFIFATFDFPCTIIWSSLSMYAYRFQMSLFFLLSLRLGIYFEFFCWFLNIMEYCYL